MLQLVCVCAQSVKHTHANLKPKKERYNMQLYEVRVKINGFSGDTFTVQIQAENAHAAEAQAYATYGRENVLYYRTISSNDTW